MKKFILIFVVIAVLGLIFLPKYLSEDKPHGAEGKKELKEDSKEKSKEDKFEEMSSKEETTEEPKDDELEPQISGFEKDIYFENGDKLYKAFTPEDVEIVKKTIQTYIHNNIDSNISECKVTSTSLKNNTITINVAINEKEVITVNVEKNNTSNIEIVKK